MVKDIDRGWKAIKRELLLAQYREVAVGILEGSKGAKGASLPEYATYNEFGTETIPSRPFMATSFDESRVLIDADFAKQSRALVSGTRTADQALTIVGQKHAERIKETITGRNFLPKLAERTIRAKNGSTKTLVDTGAMVNAVQISVRDR